MKAGTRPDLSRELVADAGRPGGQDFRPVLVWDLPVRIVHWLMVLCVAGAYLTAGRDAWQLVHAALGYALGGLAGLRILWGLVGTRHARFANFVRGPRAVLHYLLRDMPHGWGKRYAGHSPAGAVAVAALLLLPLLVAASGGAAHAATQAAWLATLHAWAAHAMLAVIGLHVAGVVFASWRAGENLVRAMVDGRKRGNGDGE